MILQDAFILAAGLGTRMRQHTQHVPKALMRYEGVALIDFPLGALEACGVRRILVNSHANAALLEHYLMEHWHLRLAAQGITLEIAHEPLLLGTGGSLLRAISWTEGRPFFSMGCDTWVPDLGNPRSVEPYARTLERLDASWNAADMDMLLSLHPYEQVIGHDVPHGDFDLTDDQQLLWPATAAAYVMGARIISHAALQRTVTALSSDATLSAMSASMPPFHFHALLAAHSTGTDADKRLDRIRAIVYDAEMFCHMSTPESLQQALHHHDRVYAARL